MLRSIILWLLDFLRESLDPELKQRIDQYKADAAKQDEEIRQAQAELAKLEARKAELLQQRTALAEEIAASEKITQEIEAQREKVREDEVVEKHDIATRSDADVIRGEL